MFPSCFWWFAELSAPGKWDGLKADHGEARLGILKTRCSSKKKKQKNKPDCAQREKTDKQNRWHHKNHGGIHMSTPQACFQSRKEKLPTTLPAHTPLRHISLLPAKHAEGPETKTRISNTTQQFSNSRELSGRHREAAVVGCHCSKCVPTARVWRLSAPWELAEYLGGRTLSQRPSDHWDMPLKGIWGRFFFFPLYKSKRVPWTVLMPPEW